MSVVGKKIDHFPVPVCNKFVKTTLNGHVCYSIDINELKNEMEFSIDTHKIGLKLLLDYNEDRQYLEYQPNIESSIDHSDVKFIPSRKDENKNEPVIYVGSLGICLFSVLYLIYM